MKFLAKFTGNFKPCLLLALVMLAIPFGSEPAWAADAAGGGSGSSAMAKLNEICNVELVDSGSGQLKIFSVGVKCFENIVKGLAEDAIEKFSAYLQDVVYSLLVLYLIFFGSKVSLGFTSGEKVKSEFVIHALKIAFVAWLVFSLGLINIYQMILGSYHSLIEIVMEGADFGDCQQSGGGGTGGGGGEGTDAIWATMDCMFSKFVGWDAQNGWGANWANVPLLFGYITSKALPANGFIIGGLVFTTLWTLLIGFFRVAFVYILSLIALILLFAISPLVVPLMLFKQTEEYFKGWVRLVISMVLQPVILFAFFAFVASLLAETITKLTEVFKNLKLSHETTGRTVTGVAQDIRQMLSAGNNADKDMVLQTLVTLIIAVLLASFTNFVSRMALELAGQGSAPELGSKIHAPSMLGGGRR